VDAVTEIDTALCLNNVNLGNVIFNDTDSFVDSVSLIDVTETDTGLCLSSVSFPSIILNDTGTPVFCQWYCIPVSVMEHDTCF
jgi:hypothetical protein